MPWPCPSGAGGIPLQASPYPPPYEPTGMPTPPPPLPPPRKPSSTDLFLRIGVVFLGLSLAVGLITFHAAFFVPAPTSGTPPSPAYQAYSDTVRMLGIISFVFMDIAVGFSVILAMFVGLSKDAIPDVTRRGAWLFAVVVPTAWLLVSWSLYSVFRSLVWYGF